MHTDYINFSINKWMATALKSRSNIIIQYLVSPQTYHLCSRLNFQGTQPLVFMGKSLVTFRLNKTWYFIWYFLSIFLVFTWFLLGIFLTFTWYFFH